MLLGERTASVRCMDGLVVAAGTVIAWWGLLGWDTQRTRGRDGDLHGPYASWQVVLFIVAIGLLAVWSGRRRDSFVGALVAAIVLAVSFSISTQMSASLDDGLWLFGAAAAAIVTFCEFLAVSTVAAAMTRRSGRRSPGASSPH